MFLSIQAAFHLNILMCIVNQNMVYIFWNCLTDHFKAFCCFFSHCLTIALKWLLLFRCTIESRYLCYYATSNLSGYPKGKVISKSFKF